MCALSRLGRILAAFLTFAGLAPTDAGAEVLFHSGFEQLQPAPEVRILRDDRIATLEIDYNADNAWGQWWTMSGTGNEPAGFLVSWWPAGEASLVTSLQTVLHGDGSMGCLTDLAQSPTAPSSVRWLVTANRRVQLQPLVNDASYQVRVERISTLGEIISEPRLLTFAGGDGARVAALRASLTYFDDFNLPLGAADEKLWNNATATSSDPRFNLFFINDQFHAHTLQGTRVDNTGDKSQTAQRFRKRIRVESGVRRRVVFDMDSPLSPRSVWYLDFNPVATDLTGHADFFDAEGATGLPAGMLRLRAQGQMLSVNLIDMQGASHPIASVDMEAAGRQAVTNVRRHFDVRVGIEGIQVFIDGRSVIDVAYAPYSLQTGDYELLWVGFGYNTAKDAVPYYLLHWDNFGFDGPVVDARTVHNYVTRIADTDYRKANRSSSTFPIFTVPIPDDLRPTTAGTTAEAWLVLTYQMGDYSQFTLAPGDHVRVNGSTNYPLPPRANNSLPNNPGLLAWGMPHTVRIKLGDMVQGGVSPLRVGDNTLQFFAENTGILNVHIEALYPPGSAPTYTPPSAIHPFPLHADLPRLGLPARFERIGNTAVEERHLIGQQPAERITISGVVPLTMVVGNHSYAGWAPQLLLFPVASTEVWSTGGTTGIAAIEVYLRRVGSGTGPGDQVLRLDTARHVPSPQGRYVRSLDTTSLANGDYEIFLQAISPSGLKSHPSYGNEAQLWDAAQLSGAYYPIPIRVQN
ncbi:MAG: hypothetical protein JNN30_11150 [Rhodanobacteraceae bacterium]|nr:hypothetical protein [Rhodanobacteraceae bacterium]